MTETAAGSQERFLKEIFIEDDSELIVNEEAAQSETKDDEFDIDSLDKVSQDPPKGSKKSRKSATPKKVVLHKDVQSPMSKKAQILAQKARKEAAAEAEKPAEPEDSPEKEGEASDEDSPMGEATTHEGESSDVEEGETGPEPDEPDNAETADVEEAAAEQPAEEESAEDETAEEEKEDKVEKEKEKAAAPKPVKTASKPVKRRPGLAKKKAPSKPEGSPTLGKGAGEEDEYSSKSVAELKALCKERKLPVTGSKTVLLGHLRGTSEAAAKAAAKAAAAKAGTPKAVKATKKVAVKKKKVAEKDSEATPTTPKKVTKKRKAEGDSPEAPSNKKQRTPSKEKATAKSPTKAKSPSKSKSAAKAKSPAKAKAPAKKAKKIVPNAIVASGIDFGFKDVASSMCKTLGKYKYADNLDETCKYLVVGSKESRTVKLFLAMVNGITVLKFNWILDSLEDSCWKDPLMYEAKDWFPGCRMTREVLKQKGSLDLLQGERCYIGSTFAPRDVLTELVQRLGGTVAPMRQATVCLNKSQIASSKNQQGLPVVTERWLIDSLLAYKTADYGAYAPEDAAGFDDDEEMEESAESDAEEEDDDFDVADAAEEEEDDDEDEEMEDAD